MDLEQIVESADITRDSDYLYYMGLVFSALVERECPRRKADQIISQKASHIFYCYECGDNYKGVASRLLRLAP